MKKFILFLFISMIWVTIYAQIETPEVEPTIVSYILNAVIGVLIYHGQKVIATWRNFVFAYWWKANKLQFLGALIGTIGASLMQLYNPTLLVDLLGYLGIAFNGTVGTIAFSVLFSGVIYEAMKKFLPGNVVKKEEAINIANA